jgi:16S rRNA processing protein RimM
LTSSTDVVAGRVGRPHGLDGSFHVLRPLVELLARGSTVRIGDAAYEVVRRAGTDEKPIVRLGGVADREGAEALRGLDMVVPREAAPPLGEDEWYGTDLVGCWVVDGCEPVGEVEAFVPLPSCEALQVGDRLIPLVKDAVRSVDLEKRVIEVDLEFLGGA